MCQRCHEDFDPSSNHDTACCFHAESWSGETAQRWKNPGEEKGGAEVYFFYSCCGASARNAPGCCAARHYGFGEEMPATYDTNAGQERKKKRDYLEMAAVCAPAVSTRPQIPASDNGTQET